MASDGYEHEGLTSCDTDQQIGMLNCPVGQNDLNQTIYFAIEIVYTGIPHTQKIARFSTWNMTISEKVSEFGPQVR